MSKRKRFDDANPKDRIGEMKAPVGYYPNSARIGASRVFANSAPEYGRSNWRTKKVRLSIYLDAIDRHSIALRAGQDIDPKSGLPHEDHINACAAIINEARAIGNLFDDRLELDPSARILDAITAAGHDAARRSLRPSPARTLDQVRAEEARRKRRRRRGR